MSGSPRRTDIAEREHQVRFVPIADTRFAPTLVRFAAVNRRAVASLPKANLVNVNRSKTFDDDLSKFEERAVDPIAFLDKLVKGVVLALTIFFN